MCTPTFKPGYVKLNAEALAKQKFKDFEWVLIDDLYDIRGKAVEEFLEATGITYVYKPPRKYHDYFDCAGALNSCLLYATGELVYWMNDYEYPLHTTLARHWYLHKKYGPKAFYTGLIKTYPHLEIPNIEWISIYNPHPKYWLNIFKGKVNYKKLSLYPLKMPYKKELEPLVYEITEMEELWSTKTRGFWAGRNDSCPLEMALDLNGFNECLSGAWGGQDNDFHERMLVAYGAKYIKDGNVENLSLELPNPFAGQKRTIKGIRERDVELYKLRDTYTFKQKRYRSFNKWNIRKERKKIGSE